MINKIFITLLIFFLFLGISFSTSWGRASAEFENIKDFQSSLSNADPALAVVAHRIGKIVLSVNNNGTFGTGFTSGDRRDFFTGQATPSCEYPKNSNIRYLFAGAFWIGAIVGRDTLVSVAADGWSYVREFFPDEAPMGKIVKRSIIFPNTPEFEDAVSEEDYIMVYTDNTFTDGIGRDYFGRPHTPLNIEVTQASYAWSYTYAEDFVLFDYKIKNIGTKILNNVYMGIYVDADVYFEGARSTGGWWDDICGFIETIPITYKGCEYIDTVNIAWIADNDGDFDGPPDVLPAPGVTGTRIIRTPADSLDVSFNWWISNSSPSLDFGPRERAFMGKWKEDFRDFRTGGLGTPEGDVNKYYQLKNREFDYDQVYSATIQATDSLWLQPPPYEAPFYAVGLDTRYLLSFGPFDINPGEKLPISFAYVGGENFHISPDNINNLPDDPDTYYQNIGFGDLGLNAAWADRVYDNPGVDTDNDGYAGKYRICCFDSTISQLDTNINGQDTTITVINYTLCDTIFYQGDGVPDFKGASPPPAPDFWLQPEVGAIHVRFNGLRSENTRDVFSNVIDFEGYRIYIGRDTRETSFTLLASYDIENYNKYVWNESKIPEAGFELYDFPYSLDTLRCLYGDSCNDPNFNPLNYTRNAPYFHPQYSDSFFYFEPQDYNSSEFGVTTPIRKIYPNQSYPSTLDPDSADTNELTDDGYFKYFEYEFNIENLLPTVQWWVSVTAFDFGSPESDIQSLESSKTNYAQAAFPQNSADEVLANNHKVYIYPNPYISNAGYRSQGYEGIDTDNESSLWGQYLSDRPDDRLRKINFANLPPKCTIRIYSIDGDLIREIEHDKDPSDPNATHNEWDLITRNTQLIVSGLYYWVVESDNGETQIGKLVIIM